MVTTTADEIKDRLEQKIKDTRTNLVEINNAINNMLDIDTWGADNFSELFVGDSNSFEDGVRKLKQYIDVYLRKWF